MALMMNEILLEIFQYLNIRDRKNARLVCKKWYEVANYRMFKHKEAFSFCVSYDFSTITKIILDSGCETVNLKLKNYCLNPSNSGYFWRTCGPKIKSLELTSCLIIGGVWAYIIVHCPNMVQFTTKERRLNDNCGTVFNRNTIYHVRLIESGYDNSCTRQRLTTLDFHTFIWVPTIYPNFTHISSSFPNLRSLKISLVNNEHFPLLLAYLAAPTTQVDTLFVELPDRDLSCMCNYDLSKLKDVGMSIRDWQPRDDNLNTILNYKFWTSLFLPASIFSYPHRTFVIRLLEGCPKLNTLNVSLKITEITEFFDVFPSFVKSRLKTLKVFFDDSELPECERKVLEATAKNASPIPGLPKNDTIRQLSLMSAKTEGFSLIFVKYFPKVRHLSVSNVCLKDVLQNLPELEALQLNSDVYYHAFDAPIPHPPITCLRFMAISCLHFAVLFSETSFPSLEYLSLQRTDEYEIFDLLKDYVDCDLRENDYNTKSKLFALRISIILPKITENCPRLRGLSLDLTNSFDERHIVRHELLEKFFKSCLKLSEIRYIWVHARNTDKTFAEKHIKMCFEQIPSLRAVICLSENWGISSFFDVFKSKIVIQEAGFYDLHAFYMYPIDYWLNGR